MRKFSKIGNDQLTPDQKYSGEIFNSWLEKKANQEPFILRGFAGSGKTFLAMKLLQVVEAKGLCWTVAAPTHKAVGVLKNTL